MADNTKHGFKQTAREIGSSVKNYSKSYAGDLRRAYGIGYSRGWDDARYIPDRVGAKVAAGVGYKKGITNRKKSEKYSSQYKKSAKLINGNA